GGAVSAEEQRGVVTAIGVFKLARVVVVHSEEERGIAVIGRVFVEKLIDGFQEARKIIERTRVTAAQVGLQVGHQQRTGNALPGNVGQDEGEMPGGVIEGARRSSIHTLR